MIDVKCYRKNLGESRGFFMPTKKDSSSWAGWANSNCTQKTHWMRALGQRNSICTGVQLDIPKNPSGNLDLQKKLIIFVEKDLAASNVIITLVV